MYHRSNAHPGLLQLQSPSMESLDDFLRKAESVLCPTSSSDADDYDGGPLCVSSLSSLVFSSLDSLPSMCEPTPIDPKSAVFVREVPLANAVWHKDEGFLRNLKMLVRETATKPSPLMKSNSFSVSNLKRSHETYLVDEDSSKEGFQSTSMPRPKKRQRTISSSATSCCSDSIDSGFRNSHVEQWNQRYLELVSFHNEFQHCLVPLNWERNPSLAHWVKRQRYQYRIKQEGKHSTMTAERQAALANLGFVWDSHAAGWEERLQELATFKQIFGHTNVPKKYSENPQLAIWVKCQRRQFKLHTESKSSNMTPDRIARLCSLGFVFNPRMTSSKYNDPF